MPIYVRANFVHISKDRFVGTIKERGRTVRGRVVPALSWEGESGPQRADRRSHLGQLDRVLEVLEELNLEGERTVPPEVRRQLELCGIVTLAEESPSAVLERVLNGQEVYLLHPVTVLPPKVEGRRARSPRPDA
ncbi:MAG TPA: hypothetical protein VNH38_04795 [Candidatus Dormibacteraeota bacterium]|nr:hypothetical protein [Candidatus Dormibacteraeota bacterium]